jgi:hypothetical protein
MKASMSVNFPVQMPHPNIDASLRQQLASPVVHLCGVQRAPEVGTLCQAVLVEAGEEPWKMQRSTSDSLLRHHSVATGTSLSNAASTNDCSPILYSESRARSSPCGRKEGKHDCARDIHASGISASALATPASTTHPSPARSNHLPFDILTLASRRSSRIPLRPDDTPALHSAAGIVCQVTSGIRLPIFFLSNHGCCHRFIFISCSRSFGLESGEDHPAKFAHDIPIPNITSVERPSFQEHRAVWPVPAHHVVLCAYLA